MSDRQIEQRPMEAIVLGYTTEQVHKALVDMGHDMCCPACDQTNYNLAVADGKPCVIDGKMVSHPGQSLWFFSLICINCGTCRLVEAVTVAKHIDQGAEHEG